MEIREYYGKELVQFQKLAAPMFRRADPQLADEEKYAEVLERQDAARDKDLFRLGAFEGDRLCATLRSEPYRIHLDGREMTMGGIAAVISGFNNPVKGLMKELFKKAFVMMRERGQYVSHLYPFKANYYRQYGYDISCKHHLWKIPLEYFADDRSGKYVYYDGSDKMKAEIRSIYSSFSGNYNLSVVKTEAMWERFFETILPYAGVHFSYLHYTDGQADAFMSYKLVENPDRPQDFLADHLWFTSYQGLRGILSYFVTQRPYGDRALIVLPTNVDPSACSEFKGGWAKRDSQCETVFDGTSRVVDVEKVLEAVRYRGCGTVAIQVENDLYCPWNNDTFTVSFGEETQVTRGGTPDIVMDINAFSPMILGAVSLEDAFVFPSVKIYGNRENLEKVFYKKNLFIDVHF